MFINPIKNYSIKPLCANNQKKFCRKSNPVCDTVSFTAMKRTAFEGADLVCVNRYKAPIEKFNKNDDLQNWCKEKRKEEFYLPKFDMSTNYTSSRDRLAIFDEWQDFLEDKECPYKESQKLLIAQGLTKGIKTSNSYLPPFLNKEVLAQTMAQIDSEAGNAKGADANFHDCYIENLKDIFLKDFETDENGKKSGWLIIPQGLYGSDNYRESVQKLQLFSHKMWCTKSDKASGYIGRGAFHIYIDKGKSVLATRYDGDTLVEIQSATNNSEVKDEYLPILVEHIKDDKANFDAGLMRGFYKQKLKDL